MAGEFAAQRRVERPRADPTLENTKACPRGPLERIVGPQHEVM